MESLLFFLIISFFSLTAWIYLAAFRDRFWIGGERLTAYPAPGHWPHVVAVIPARNESATIGDVVAAHMAADYAGRFNVTVVDDHSSDHTADIARNAGDANRLSVITAPELPNGWSGKLNAVAAGVAATEETDPKYFLLTDADIVLAQTTLSNLVAKAEAEDLALTSLMARLDARGFWGTLLIPAFIYFFQKLYPFPAANNPHRALAAAAGGCMLIRANALETTGGIDAIKGTLIDDCALADVIKNRNGRRRIWLGLAKDEAVSLRDNRSLSSVWNMVARTAFAQLNHSWIYLVGAVIGMILIYLMPPLMIVAGLFLSNAMSATVALIAWVLMAVTYAPTLKLYDKGIGMTATLPLAATLYTAMTVSSALRHARGKGGQWKGRVYS